MEDSSLRDVDRLFWICLKNLSKDDPEMPYKVSEKRLGEFMNEKSYTIHEALKVLGDAGYVKIFTSPESKVNAYTVCVPAQALLTQTVKTTTEFKAENED